MKLTKLTKDFVDQNGAMNDFLWHDLVHKFLTCQNISAETMNSQLLECIKPYIIGEAVDHLTRFITGDRIEEVWPILHKYRMYGTNEEVRKLDSIEFEMNSDVRTGKLSRNTIKRAIRFDIAWHDNDGDDWRDYKEINEYANFNIETMVNRSVVWLGKEGPKLASGLQVTDYNSSKLYREEIKGEIDYITRGTLWEMKVWQEEDNWFEIHMIKALLQLMGYYMLGIRDPEYTSFFASIQCLAIFNPRTDREYILSIKDIPCEAWRVMKDQVLGLPV